MDNLKIISRADAQAQGLKRYFTGKTCKHGHAAERYVSSGGCVECILKCAAEYAIANPERVRECLHNRIKANPEKHLESARKSMSKRYSESPEIRSYSYAKTQLRNAAKLKAIPLRSYIGDTDDQRQELMTEHHSAIDAGSHGFMRYVTEDYWNSLIRAEKLRALIGSELFPDCVMTTDHWIPLNKGGEHHPDNFKYIMSGPLNSSKNDQLPAPEGDWQLPAPQYDRVTWRTSRGGQA